MNERIRLLAEQSGYGTRWTTTEQFEEFMNKFADSIINECVYTIQDFVDHRIPASEYSDRLRRYFEVE